MTDCFAKILFSNPSPESLPIPKIDSEPTTISETDPQNPGNATAKKIIEERKNKEDEPGIGWFVVGLLLLSVLFVFIVFNFYASIFSIILSILAALLAILAGMAEIRVKRNDEVIAGIKDNKPETAKSMSHDPWVVAWRRNALWLKYLSLLAVLVVALAALIK